MGILFRNVLFFIYLGIWYEEMVNNRQKSLVKGMAWNHDGMKICITYDDGKAFRHAFLIIYIYVFEIIVVYIHT